MFIFINWKWCLFLFYTRRLVFSQCYTFFGEVFFLVFLYLIWENWPAGTRTSSCSWAPPPSEMLGRSHWSLLWAVCASPALLFQSSSPGTCEATEGGKKTNKGFECFSSLWPRWGIHTVASCWDRWLRRKTNTARSMTSILNTIPVRFIFRSK